MTDEQLMHFGVKGMKWGVRRYQNDDGSLTDAGKKRVSKQYKKYAVKGERALDKSYNDRYLKAYNKAADDMNNGMIDKYNNDYKKKLGAKAAGHDYGNDRKYIEGYEKMFNDRLNKHFNQLTLKELQNNKNLQKAREYCDKYNMTSFDELAKQNAEAIDILMKKMEE